MLETFRKQSNIFYSKDWLIAIELNLSNGEMEEFRLEYLKLKGDDQLLGIYRRIGGNIEPFLELYEMMNKEDLFPQEAIWALQDYGSFKKYFRTTIWTVGS